jgi:hypothetical protein
LGNVKCTGCQTGFASGAFFTFNSYYTVSTLADSSSRAGRNTGGFGTMQTGMQGESSFHLGEDPLSDFINPNQFYAAGSDAFPLLASHLTSFALDTSGSIETKAVLLFQDFSSIILLILTSVCLAI